MRQSVKVLDALSGNSWGATSTLNLDTGLIYDSIALESADTDLLLGAARIEVLLNGDPIVSVSPSALALLNAVKGITNTSQRLVIPFADSSAATDEGQHLTSLVTMQSDSLVLKIRWSSAYQGAPQLPSVGGYFVGRNLYSSDNVRAFIPRIYEDTLQAGITGRNPYKTFPRGARIRSMHLMSATVERLEINRQGVTVFDMTKSANDGLIDDSGYSSQVGVFSFLPTAPGRFNRMDFLSTAVQSFEIIPTVSAAGNISTVFEVIEADSKAPVPVAK